MVRKKFTAEQSDWLRAYILKNFPPTDPLTSPLSANRRDWKKISEAYTERFGHERTRSSLAVKYQNIYNFAKSAIGFEWTEEMDKWLINNHDMGEGEWKVKFGDEREDRVLTDRRVELKASEGGWESGIGVYGVL